MIFAGGYISVPYTRTPLLRPKQTIKTDTVDSTTGDASVLLSTDRRVLTNIRDSKKGYTFKELCDLSGVQAGDITKSLQYLIGKDFIQSIERPEGRVFLITERGTQELNGNREPEELKCRYCEKPYSERGWLTRHETKCKKRPAMPGIREPPGAKERAYSSATPTELARRTLIDSKRSYSSEAAPIEMPIMPAQTVRCNGCGSLHQIKRKYGAELLECPLCLTET